MWISAFIAVLLVVDNVQSSSDSTHHVPVRSPDLLLGDNFNLRMTQFLEADVYARKHVLSKEPQDISGIEVYPDGHGPSQLTPGDCLNELIQIFQLAAEGNG
jgi:hypothetical protein